MSCSRFFVSEFVSEGFQLIKIKSAVEYFTLEYFCIGGDFLKIFSSFSKSTAPRCCKKNDFFTRKVIAFKESIDDRGSCVPPYRKAYKNRVIYSNIGIVVCKLRARGFVFHFDRRTAFGVTPVKVCICVGDFGFYFIDTCISRTCKVS